MLKGTGGIDSWALTVPVAEVGTAAGAETEPVPAAGELTAGVSTAATVELAGMVTDSTGADDPAAGTDATGSTAGEEATGAEV